VESKYWYSSDCEVCGKHIAKAKSEYGEGGGSWVIPRDPMDLAGMDDSLDILLGGIMIGLALIVWAWVLI